MLQLLGIFAAVYLKLINRSIDQVQPPLLSILISDSSCCTSTDFRNSESAFLIFFARIVRNAVLFIFALQDDMWFDLYFIRSVLKFPAHPRSVILVTEAD